MTALRATGRLTATGQSSNDNRTPGDSSVVIAQSRGVDAAGAHPSPIVAYTSAVPPTTWKLQTEFTVAMAVHELGPPEKLERMNAVEPAGNDETLVDPTVTANGEPGALSASVSPGTPSTMSCTTGLVIHSAFNVVLSPD